MAAEIHVDDIGTAFRFTFKDEEDEILDISTSSDLEIWFEKPSLEDGGDPVFVPKDATLYTDGTDGIAQYITASGDLDRSGNWRIQGFAKIGTAEIHSDIHKFKVFPNLG